MPVVAVAGWHRPLRLGRRRTGRMTSRTPSRYDRIMSPERRDSEGHRQVGPTWESVVERQIREAMDEGAFTELPFVGQRLPIEDDSAAGEWALAHRMLKNAGAAPPWIESDKEARRHLAEIERLDEAAAEATIVSRARLRRDVVQAVTAANHAIE